MHGVADKILLGQTGQTLEAWGLEMALEVQTFQDMYTELVASNGIQLAPKLYI